MEEKTATTDGATKTGSEITIETIYSPSKSVVAAVEATEAELRQGTWPKELAPGQVAQLNTSGVGFWGNVAGASDQSKQSGVGPCL